MNPGKPHYLLDLRTEGEEGPGRWRFSLRRSDAPEQIEAQDVEPQLRGERLELLTLIRALESLDQPARVSLVGGSRSLHRGILYGLPDWRESGWCWEYFGQMVPIKNGDLWQRLDRALQFHRIECRHWRLDPPHTHQPQPADAPAAVRVLATQTASANVSAERRRDFSEHYTSETISGRFTVLGIVLTWARWVACTASSWFQWFPAEGRLFVALPRIVTSGWVARNPARR